MGRTRRPVGRCLQPRARRAERAGRVRRRRRSWIAAVAAAAEAARTWGRTSLAGRARILFAFRELVERRKRDLAEILTREHGKVLSDAARRGQSRARGRRVRLRAAASSQGRVLRERLDRRRQLLDPAAARRSRRHHAVQFPGDGADVDVPARDRVRERVHPEAIGEGPVGGDVLRASSSPKPAFRPASSPSSMATKWRRRRHPVASRHSGRELRRLDADRALHLRDRHAARQARAGARRGEESHDRPARRGSRPGSGFGGQRRDTARPASAAWRSRCSSPSETSPIACCRACASGCASSRSRSGPRARR